MTQLNVTIEHAGAHEPNGETFADDFGKALNSALHEQGLKRSADFSDTIVGYTQTSGASTTYTVEVDGTEPTAAALKEADAAKPTAADAKPAKADKG